MTADEAKKILSGNVAAISSEILQKAAEKILSELSKAEEKISFLEKKFYGSNDLPDEIWKDIEGFEGLYQVSNFLRVKSLRWHGGRIMKPKISKHGYPCLSLCKDGKRKFSAVHILAAKAFIPNPENKPVVHHVNSNPTTCTVDELEWATYGENEKYAYQDNRKFGREGESNPVAKLTNEDVTEIVNSYISGDSEFGGRALAKKFGVSPTAISYIICNKTFKASVPRKSMKNDLRGANNPLSKLTEEQVKFIRENYKPQDKNFGAKALAKKFNVCYQTIWLITSGKTWKK